MRGNGPKPLFGRSYNSFCYLLWFIKCSPIKPLSDLCSPKHIIRIVSFCCIANFWYLHCTVLFTVLLSMLGLNLDTQPRTNMQYSNACFSWVLWVYLRVTVKVMSLLSFHVVNSLVPLRHCYRHCNTAYNENQECCSFPVHEKHTHIFHTHTSPVHVFFVCLCLCVWGWWRKDLHDTSIYFSIFFPSLAGFSQFPSFVHAALICPSCSTYLSHTFSPLFSFSLFLSCWIKDMSTL